MNTLIEVCEYGSEMFRLLIDIRLCPECKIRPNCFLVRIMHSIEKGVDGHRAFIPYCDLYQRLDKKEILKI